MTHWLQVLILVLIFLISILCNRINVNTASDIRKFSQNCTNLKASVICKNFEKCQE